jgi:hypothetical protein
MAIASRTPFPAAPAVKTASLANQLRTRDSNRLMRYQELQHFYDGRHFDERKRRTNLTVNYGRTVVDKGVSYLFARGVDLRADTAAAQELLQSVWDGNDLDALLLQAATNAGTLGDAFLKVYYDPASDRIRVYNLDPSGVFPLWQGDDPASLREVCCVWMLSEAETLARYGIGRGCENLYIELVECWTASTVRLYVGEDLVLDTPNTYGFLPFVHLPNLAPPNRNWGTSDLTDLMGINIEYELRLNDQSDVIRYHADPPVIFKGVREHSDLAVGPATVWDIPADADVSLLEWKGESPAVGEHLDRLKRALFEVAETPQTAFGDSGKLLSGVALETELQPIVQRTLRRRTLWGPRLATIARMIWRLAELANLGAGFAPYRVQVLWRQMLPLDDDAEANRHVALIGANLESHRTAIEQMDINDDPAAELVRIAEDLAQLQATLPTPAPSPQRNGALP